LWTLRKRRPRCMIYKTTKPARVGARRKRSRWRVVCSCPRSGRLPCPMLWPSLLTAWCLLRRGAHLCMCGGLTPSSLEMRYVVCAACARASPCVTTNECWRMLPVVCAAGTAPASRVRLCIACMLHVLDVRMFTPCFQECLCLGVTPRCDLCRRRLPCPRLSSCWETALPCWIGVTTGSSWLLCPWRAGSWQCLLPRVPWSCLLPLFQSPGPVGACRWLPPSSCMLVVSVPALVLHMRAHVIPGYAWAAAWLPSSMLASSGVPPPLGVGLRDGRVVMFDVSGGGLRSVPCPPSIVPPADLDTPCAGDVCHCLGGPCPSFACLPACLPKCVGVLWRC
jgi:hypothetical protein